MQAKGGATPVAMPEVGAGSDGKTRLRLPSALLVAARCVTMAQ